MTIGQRIKALREQKSISQIELAEKMGVSKQNLYKYENGIISNIPSDKIEAAAAALETSPAYLMGWDDTPPTTEDTIVKLIKAQYHLNEQDVKFVMDYIKLAPNEREALRTAIEAIKKIKDAD
ncbi:helix-turn-helix domain-containing protein [Ruminococcus sp.]|uniref:helix-turn-helix domain-containing protein n=1 Tax=Ruminococcus sp. TaxID=41978 RepID=UPI00386B10A3